jgi:hypothetical protein
MTGKAYTLANRRNSPRGYRGPGEACGRNPNHHSRKKRKKAKKGTDRAGWRYGPFLRLLSFCSARFFSVLSVFFLSSGPLRLCGAEFGVGRGPDRAKQSQSHARGQEWARTGKVAQAGPGGAKAYQTKPIPPER